MGTLGPSYEDIQAIYDTLNESEIYAHRLKHPEKKFRLWPNNARSDLARERAQNAFMKQRLEARGLGARLDRSIGSKGTLPPIATKPPLPSIFRSPAEVAAYQRAANQRRHNKKSGVDLKALAAIAAEREEQRLAALEAQKAKKLAEDKERRNAEHRRAIAAMMRREEADAAAERERKEKERAAALTLRLGSTKMRPLMTGDLKAIHQKQLAKTTILFELNDETSDSDSILKEIKSLTKDDLDAVIDSDGNTFLIKVCMKGLSNVALELIRKGVLLRTKNNSGFDAKYYADLNGLSKVSKAINDKLNPPGGSNWSLPPLSIKKGGYRATRRDKKYLKLYKQGKSIGFTMRSSLKAKGLIPRANGTRRVSKKYRN